VALAEVREQFGDQNERKCLPLEAATRGVVKRQQTEKAQCVLQSSAESVSYL
jgi:hypothetical protein